jgi:hypothetical protein
MRNLGAHPLFATRGVAVSGNGLSIPNVALSWYESVESGGVEEVPTPRNFAVEQSAQRRCSGRTFTRFCNTHGYACDPPNDSDVAWIADMPGMSV